jgi:hypothetical protein
MMNATSYKTRLWLLLLIGVLATLFGQTHAGEIFAPSPHESGVFAAQTQASTGENYDGIQYDALDSLLAANTGVGLVDDAARLPVGQLGNPMQVPGPQNLPTVINGRSYTGHALDQMQGRGLMPSVVEDTISTGVQSAGRDGAQIFTTGQARIIVNPNGSIKTVYPR